MKPLFTIWLVMVFHFTLEAQTVTDSLFNAKLTLKPSFKLPDTKALNNPLDSSKHRFKKPGSKKTSNLFSFHGNATIDLYYATAQNPRQLNESQYARCYFNPTISIMGLPFTTNVFLTTENNNFFNSNSISFRFDVQAYKKQLAEEYQKKLQEERKKLGTANTDILKTDKLLDQQLKELEKSKKELAKSDKIAADAISRYKEEQVRNLRDSFNHFKNGKGRLMDSLGGCTTVNDSGLQRLTDSFERLKTAQMERLEKLNNRIDELRRHKDSTKEMVEIFKSQVEKYSELAKDPTVLINNRQKQLEDSTNLFKEKFRIKLSDIRQFDAGLFYANQTELTASGLPVKGIHAVLEPGKLIVGAGGGRTMSSFNALSTQKQDFDRNVAIWCVGYKFFDQFRLVWNGGYIWDDHKGNTINKSNNYHSLTLDHQFRQLKVNGEVAYSRIQSTGGYLDNAKASTTTPSYFNYRFSDHIAYKIKAQYELFKTVSISGGYTKVPISYLNLGNPYMRRDYREYELSFNQKLFKNKILTSVFYKENTNNLNRFETYTTTAKGYGLSLQTNFNDAPNLSLNYLPYNMGNNHPDSVLQTRSQFSVVNAVLSYSYFSEKIVSSSLLMFSQSQAELAPGQLSGNIMISANQTVDYKNKISLNIVYNASRFQFTSDTLNFNQYKLQSTFKYSKIIQPTAACDYIQYKNGASKLSFISGFNLRIKKTFSFRMNYSFSHLYKLWGYDEAFAHQMKGSLVFLW